MANQHQQAHQLQSLANMVTEEFIFIKEKLANVFKFFLKHVEELPNPLFSKGDQNQTTSKDIKEPIHLLTWRGPELIRFLTQHGNNSRHNNMPKEPLPLVADLDIWRELKIRTKKQRRKKISLKD